MVCLFYLTNFFFWSLSIALADIYSFKNTSHQSKQENISFSRLEKKSHASHILVPRNLKQFLFLFQALLYLCFNALYLYVAFYKNIILHILMFASIFFFWSENSWRKEEGAIVFRILTCKGVREEHG